MEKAHLIARLAETEADKVLLARIHDRILGAERKNVPAATCFLSKREQALARELLRGTKLHFFGGYPGAERSVCCWIPDYWEPDDWLHGGDGPVCALRASFFAEDQLSHRDVLGALMGIGIKRETVGDLLIGEGQFDFLMTREIRPYVEQNLETAGRTKLRLSSIGLETLEPPETRTIAIRDTVSTLRLDSIVAAGFHLSRGKAAFLVESGKTSINDLPCEKPDRMVAEGDQISVRGLGKIVLTTVSGTTKKGRTGIFISRFV